jgi:serine/threonine-protein kinase
MAKVYLALLAGPSGFNKLLVLKIMRQDLLAGSEQSVGMFWAEARLAARLVHHNIVHTYEVGEHDGHYFLAMEYLDGQPLSAILNRARGQAAIPGEEYLRVVAEVAHGLHYAHQLRDFQRESLEVVHRDVSPQNVIVTFDGQVKLLDFGIAKSKEAELATDHGIVKGKLDYIAPEQLRGDHVDARADVFALGAILWEVITGHRFAGGRKIDDVSKAQARVVGKERKVRALKPEVPLELERIVERALAIDPAERFQDAASFAAAIEEYLEWANLRPTARSLALHLDELFAAERRDLHKLIDEQVQHIGRDAADGEARTTEPPTVAVGRAQGALGSYVADAELDDRSSFHGVDAATHARSSTAAPDPNARPLAVLSLGALLLAAAALLAWFGWSSNQQRAERASKAPLHAAAASSERTPPSAARATQRPQSAPPMVQDAVNSSVSITLVALPADARASLDGVPLELPFTGTFRRESALHRLELSALGYRDVKQFIAFDADKTIEIALERAHATRRVAERLRHMMGPAEQNVQRGSGALSGPTEPPRPRQGGPELQPSPESRPPHEQGGGNPVTDRPNPYTKD